MGARSAWRSSQRTRLRSGEMARHAATLCLARIAARRIPSDPSRNVVSGDAARAAALAARDAAESSSVAPPPRVSALDARAKYDATGAESDRRPRTAESVLRGFSLAFSPPPPPPPPPRRDSPTRARPDATSSTTARVTAAHLCASAGFEPTTSLCSNASNASRSRNKNATRRGGRVGVVPVEPGARRVNHDHRLAWSVSRASASAAAKTSRRDSGSNAGTTSCRRETNRRSVVACVAATAARASRD